MTSDRVVSELIPPLWEEVLWYFLDAWDSVHLRTTSTQWNVQGRCGPYALLLFEKEPMLLRELIRVGTNTQPRGELLFSMIQKKPPLVPDSEAFNSVIYKQYTRKYSTYRVAHSMITFHHAAQELRGSREGLRIFVSSKYLFIHV